MVRDFEQSISGEIERFLPSVVASRWLLSIGGFVPSKLFFSEVMAG
jgi:hypothetical protein